MKSNLQPEASCSAVTGFVEDLGNISRQESASTETISEVPSHNNSESALPNHFFPPSDIRLWTLIRILVCNLFRIHNKGKWHGSITPSSIEALESSEEVEGVGVNATIKQMIAGGKSYLPPEAEEAISSEVTFDPFKADVYSLGHSLLFIAHGGRPLDVDRLKEVDILQCSSPIKEVLRRCLAKEVEARSNCAELLDHIFSYDATFYAPHAEKHDASTSSPLVCEAIPSPKNVLSPRSEEGDPTQFRSDSPDNNPNR